MENGGEVAENLSRLYDFMTRHLVDANLKKDLRALQDVRQMMTELRDTWNQVSQQVGGQHGADTARSGHISISG